MAQDPSRPKDDGKVKLPQVNIGMNKTVPMPRAGGKGSKDDDKNTTYQGAPSEDEEEKDDAESQKLLARVRKRFARCAETESDNRKAALEDLKFKAGDQWPAEVAAQRNFDKRPCLTINKIPVFVHQVTNDLRQNRPTMTVSPVGERGDIEVAKMYRGLIRAIERDSHADIAYDTAVEGAVSNGFGYFRLLTEYESPTSFNQVAVIRRIRNPFTVYLDPDHQEPDGADCRFGFVTEMIPRDEFEDLYPDAYAMPFSQSGIGENMKQWVTTDAIRVAEYFEVGHKTRTLVSLSNGHSGWKDELSDDANKEIKRGRLSIDNERDSQERHVTWYKLTAVEILEEKEWAGQWVPIIKVIGDEIDIEGKVKLSGVIRNAKDAQRMVNYWETAYTEAVALAPKAPFVGEEGQFEGHESKWKQANTKSFPYLEYKGVALNGTPIPPPQRQQFAGVPAGIQQAITNSAQNMMATTGIRFDATLGERMIDESGKALHALNRMTDMGAFHYADNLARSLRHLGRQLIDIIPKIYDTKRMLTILREDDSEERIQIDPHAAKPYEEKQQPPTPQNQQPKKLKIFNPTYGKYGVTVTIGPSYATKRIEAAESMMAFAKALPNTATLIADLIAKELDFPGAEEMAKRLAKALPPQLLTPDQKDIPPQVQALMQAMDAQIKQLGQERQQLMVALNEKNTDRKIHMDEVNKAFEAKIYQIQEKFAEALLKITAKADETAIKADQGAAKMEQDFVKMFMDVIAKAEANVTKPDPMDKVKPALEDLKTQQSELGKAHTDLVKHLGDMAKAMAKPRKFKIERGADGLAAGVSSINE